MKPFFLLFTLSLVLGYPLKSQTAEQDGKAMYEALHEGDQQKVFDLLKQVLETHGVLIEDELSFSDSIYGGGSNAYSKDYNHIVIQETTAYGEGKKYWKQVSSFLTADKWSPKKYIKSKKRIEIQTQYTWMTALAYNLGEYCVLQSPPKRYTDGEIIVKSDQIKNQLLRYFGAYPPMERLRLEYYEILRSILPFIAEKADINVPDGKNILEWASEQNFTLSSMKDARRYMAFHYIIQLEVESTPTDLSFKKWIQEMILDPETAQLTRFKSGKSKIQAFVQTTGPSARTTAYYSDFFSLDYSTGYMKYPDTHQSEYWQLLKTGEEIKLGISMGAGEGPAITYKHARDSTYYCRLPLNTEIIFGQLSTFATGSNGTWAAIWITYDMHAEMHYLYSFFDRKDLTFPTLPPGLAESENEDGSELIKVFFDPHGNLGYLRLKGSNNDTVHLELKKYWYDFDSTLVTETTRYDLPGGEETLASNVWAWDGHLLFAYDVLSHTLVYLKDENTIIKVAGGNGNGNRDGDGSVAQFRNVQDMVMGSGGIIYLVDLERIVSPEGVIELKPVLRQVQLGAQ